MNVLIPAVPLLLAQLRETLSTLSGSYVCGACSSAVDVVGGRATGHEPWCWLDQIGGLTDEALLGAGVPQVLAERHRQIARLGYGAAHDREINGDGQLALAAAAYLMQPWRAAPDTALPPRAVWPWPDSAWKPQGGRVRQLVKAVALALAELARVVQAEADAAHPVVPAGEVDHG